jgi:hypothetical protein
VAQLEATAAGAAWLLARWAELEPLLEWGAECWDFTALAAATRLLGHRPEAMATDLVAARVFAACLAAHPQPKLLGDAWAASHPGRDAQAAAIRVRPLRDALYNRAAGRAVLRQMIADEVARLEERKRSVLEPRAALDRAEAADRALFDDGKSGVAFRRYETACEREYHKSLAECLKFRNERASAAEVEADPPPPAASAAAPVRNEPIAETPETERVANDDPFPGALPPAARMVDVPTEFDLTPPTPANRVEPPRLAAV